MNCPNCIHCTLYRYRYRYRYMYRYTLHTLHAQFKHLTGTHCIHNKPYTHYTLHTLHPTPQAQVLYTRHPTLHCTRHCTLQCTLHPTLHCTRHCTLQGVETELECGDVVLFWRIQQMLKVPFSSVFLLLALRLNLPSPCAVLLVSFCLVLASLLPAP